MDDDGEPGQTRRSLSIVEFRDVVRSRRMTRAFLDTPVPRETVLQCIDLATRAPSAGKSQGWHFVVLDGPDVARFWAITLPESKRPTFAWPHLIDAPCIVIPCADASAYVARYAEADKATTGLGVSVDAWPVPYWTVDTSFASMTFLLALEDVGLGALFFGIFNGAAELRDALGIPADVQMLGAIALGVPRGDANRAGRSSARVRHSAESVTHFGGWRSPSG